MAASRFNVRKVSLSRWMRLEELALLLGEPPTKVFRKISTSSIFNGVITPEDVFIHPDRALQIVKDHYCRLLKREMKSCGTSELKETVN